MRTKLLILLFLASLTSYAQYTLIPDVNFENKLIALGIDSGSLDGKVLNANINSIQVLDVSISNIIDLTGLKGFTQLATLNCSGNQLTSLDVSNNINLSTINCSQNQMTSLNISNLPLLNGLICSDNELTSVDISNNPILFSLHCSNNNLISLNLKNGNNTNFSTLYEDFKNNPHLNCIQVDNETYSNLNWSTFKDNTTLFSNSCGVKYTNIPNAAFENKLISLGIDKDGKNGKILTSNIIALNSLDISNSGISDITGIEDFLGLTTLNVSNNQISQLNLIWQKKLQVLDCSSNKLTNLDLSSNRELVTLSFSNNQITTTNLWNNSLLTTVKATNNSLKTFDIDGLIYIDTLEIENNQLTSLNLTENTLLIDLKCSNNQLTSLNTDQNTDLVSLFCANNQITNLDISSNPLLTEISCENNKLITLNLKNDNNTAFTTYDFRNNPNLQCIQVDNESYSNTNCSAKKDSGTNYNVYCGPFTLIPDANFENKLIALGIDLDGKNGKIVTDFISNITTIDLSNSSIANLTGIQDFFNLKSLNVLGNQLTNIDLSNNNTLQILNCSNNQLGSLDISKNTQLTDLYCNNNLLTALNLKNGKNTKLLNFDFRNNPNLKCIEVDVVSYSQTNWSAKKDPATTFELFCGNYTLIPDSAFEDYLIGNGIDKDGKNGKVMTFSISDLTDLVITGRNLTNLSGIQDFKKLKNLNCSNNKITVLDLSQNNAIETLNCSSNLITYLNLSNNKKLATLECSTNAITSLDLIQNSLLTSLNCSINQLTNLDVSKNISLSILNCSDNEINSLDIALNSLLVNINCYTNKITAIDFSKNILLTDINCSANKIKSLDFSTNSALKNLSCYNNNLISLNLKNGNYSNYNTLSLNNNTELLCISVDNEDDADTRFKKNKDSNASYSENCDKYTLIPDPNFEDFLIASRYDIDGKNGKVQTFRIKDIETLYPCNLNIKELTGIEDFKAINKLVCYSNQLTFLNVSKNKLLTSLNCDSNNITSLDISNNTTLTELFCRENKLADLDISNNTVLSKLDCSYNELLNLNIANGNNKNITSLYNKSDFTNNSNLTCIRVDDVNYSNYNWFELKDPTASYSRSCGIYADIPDSNLEIKLISLGIDKDGLNGKILKSDAQTVTDLNISGSGILNVSTLEFFTALKTLNCSGNNITELNLNQNTLLTTLDCSNTKITSLDLSKNKELTSLNCNNSKLTYFTLKNGNNSKIQSINLKTNTSLTCIEVDDFNYSNTNWSAFKDATANFSASCGIYTAIPDDNFEYKLIALGIDKDGKNGKVLTADISKLTMLDVSNSKITNLTGIEDFTGLQNFYFSKNLVNTVDLSKNTELLQLMCAQNSLTNIDLALNKKLTYLDCSDNQLANLNLDLQTNLLSLYCSGNKLTQLNLTKNSGLKALWCSKNQLTNLDLLKNVLLTDIIVSDNQLTILELTQCSNLNALDTKNNKLTTFSISKTAPIQFIVCNNNQLTNLDISNYSTLKTLNCDFNVLTTLRASNNPILNYLSCNSNQLTTLDLSQNPGLNELQCSQNKLVNIDFSQTKNLQKVHCEDNYLVDLDFSALSSLKELYSQNNNLQSLNLKYYFYDSWLHGDITNNPNLTCVNVKDKIEANQWPLLKDPNTKYSNDCIPFTQITDTNFEDKLIALGIDKDGKNGKVLTASINTLTSLNISNSNIADITGIQDFKMLEILNCSSNLLKSIDFSENLKLIQLDCSSNQLVNYNFSTNPELEKLNCSNNQFITINIANNPKLTQLNCSNNQLKRLNIKNGNNSIMVANSTINNFSNNPLLSCIIVDNATYSNTNWSAMKDATTSYAEACTAFTLIPDLAFETQLIDQGIDTDGQNGKVETSNIEALTDLNISYLGIKDLTGIQDFISLKMLFVDNNLLKNMDLSSNIFLTLLNCNDNELTKLNITKNTALEQLDCKFNQLTTIDLSKNIALWNLNTSYNQLIDLDISKNPKMYVFECSNNNLTSLNLKNGYNNNLYLDNFGLLYNNLSCISVDDVAFSNANWQFSKDDTTIFSLDCNTQSTYTLVPDINFENKLIALGIDSGVADGKVLTTSITPIKTLNVSNSSITDLTGIENFTNLQMLDASLNDISNLNVSKNLALSTLDLLSNAITNLDLSKNAALTTLDCSANLISTLNIENCKGLTKLDCNFNQLASLDISNNKSLIELNCSENQLTNLDLSNNIALDLIYCNENQLTNLNTSKNTALTIVHCNYNKLTSLDLTNNLGLKQLDFSYNKLTSLDLSKHTSFWILICNNNNLNSLNIQNGNNVNFDIPILDENPNLSCIQVDNVDFADTNWANAKDATANYSTDCQSNELYTLIPDVNFENKLIALGIDSGVADGKVLTTSITTIKTLNVSNSSIADLTGIQNFTALTELYCFNNQLTNLDVSKNLSLSYLYCFNNKLTSLDISKNTTLTQLECGLNQLTTLDVSKNLDLYYLECYSNQLTFIDVSKSLKLDHLNCESNQLTALDFSKNIALKELYCKKNLLANLDLSKNINLTNLDCNTNKLFNLNLKNGKNASLDNYELNFTYNTNLTCILVDDVTYSNANWANAKDAIANYSTDCQTNELYTLIPDVNFEKKLIALGIDAGVADGKVLTSKINTVTSLDVTYSSITDLTGIQGFVALTSFKCYGNYGLKSLDVSKNTSLTLLDCNNNYLVTSLDVSKNTVLTSLNCYATKLTSLDVSNNTKLTELQCSSNKLTSLDVSKNTALTKLICGYNYELTSLDVSKNTALLQLDCTSSKLTSLDVSKNIKLTELWSGDNQITSLNITNNLALTSLICNTNLLTTLDVSKNTALTRLLFYKNKITNINIATNTALETMDCSSNQLASLDVSKNPKMHYLYCDINQLTTLDVSKNAVLGLLDCSNNRLTSLDVSLNTELSQLECASNQLYNLNLKNGNNMLFDRFVSPDPNFIIYNVDFKNNPNLSCIQVDDANYSNTKWSTQKDATANFNTDCNQYTLITDSNFEDILIALSIDTDGKNGKVATTNLTNIKILDISNSGITNLSGIENFTALEKLICKGNSISTIDLSSNTALVYLDCSNNPLTTLNVSNNKLLVELYCDGAVTVIQKSIASSSQLMTLDLSNNTLLTKLSCSNNQLLSLDLSKNTHLTAINCSNNNLNTLNLNNNNNTLLTSENFKNNFNLSCIKVDNPTYSINNWATAKDATATYSSTCSVLGIEETVFDKISIYPNPTKGELHISNITLEKITVYDALGKLIKTVTNISGTKDNTIDLKGFPSGIYYIFLQSDGANTARKIIIE